MEITTEADEPPPEARYRRIKEKIKHLTRANLEQWTKDVFGILEEGEITWPTEGSSIFEELFDKTSALYQKPSFAKLVKELYSSYQRSTLSRDGDLFGVILEPFRSIWIENESKKEEFIAKLKIFLPLDAGFSTRFLHGLLMCCDKRERNVHFVEVLTFLIREGADPFHPIGGRDSFTLFHEKFDQLLSGSSDSDADSDAYSDADSLISLALTFPAFLKEALSKWEASRTKKGIVNDRIKFVPSQSPQGDSSHFQSLIELIVENCLEMIKVNPALCDHVDSEGRTLLHNLIGKLSFNVLLERIPQYAGGYTSLWNLMSQLVTEKNVNMRDKDQVTPYCWIVWWQESVALQGVKDKKELTRKIEDIKKHFQEKGGREEDAAHGVGICQEREMEGLLRRLIKLHKHMRDQLRRSTRTSEEIVAELKQMEKDVKMDVERIRDLKSKGCGECITRLTRTRDFKELVEKQIEIRNDRILGISGGILQVMIVEDNAQEIYSILLEHKRYTEGEKQAVNYYALFDVLKWCLDNGAHPTIDEIREISLLTVEECTTYEALSATVQVLKQLIGVYRKQGNTDPMEKIYLNPMQGLWSVKKDLRTVAGEVIRGAYGTLSNCMKSEGVINMLLFVSKEDSEDSIKECFNEADALLQRDMRDPPVTKWIEEKGKHAYSEREEKEQKEELRLTLIKRNDNWLRRSVLHLAAIYCHDEKVLNSIPKELIEGQIDAKDLNGCTPLDLAQLHGNTSAIRFLECPDARLSAQLFGKFTRFSCPDLDTLYKKYCSVILKIEYTVFEQMNKMLVLPVHECLAIENNLKELFRRMVANDGFLDAEIVMGGSVREKLKVGRWDEFDLQICTRIRPHGYEPFACLQTHEYLVKRLAEVDKKGISLLCVSVGNPWKFIWEGEDGCRGLEISVDVVPIYVKSDTLEKENRQGLIIDEAPGHPSQEHLKWKDLQSQPSWENTRCRCEWHILHNLPPGCRLGILISKAFLEALDHTSKTNLLKRQITSYAIKNTLLWLFAGKTPEVIEREHGNVIGERYGALSQQLHFTTNDPKWMTEEDVKRFAEDGRFWAEKIFDAIQFQAREYKRTLGSFLKDDCEPLHIAHEVIGLLDTCGRCLERLRPQVFFTEEERALSDKQGGDAGLRTRLQEVINRFNEEAEKVQGGRVWKRRKEVKRLKIKIEELQDEFWKHDISSDKELLGKNDSECKKLEEEIDQLLQEHDKTQLEKEQRECEELDEKLKREINKLLPPLGDANNKESVIFRIKGEIEELEKKEENDLMRQQPVGERDEELARKRKECTELEEEVEALRNDKKWHLHLEKLEKMVTDIFATVSTQDDKLQVPTEESHGDATNVDAKDDDEYDAASGDIRETCSDHDLPCSSIVPCGVADAADAADAVPLPGDESAHDVSTNDVLQVVVGTIPLCTSTVEYHNPSSAGPPVVSTNLVPECLYQSVPVVMQANTRS